MVSRSRSVSAKSHRVKQRLTRSSLAKQRPRDSHGRFLPTRRINTTPIAASRLSRPKSRRSSSRSYGNRSRSTSSSQSTSQSLRRHSHRGIDSSRHDRHYHLRRSVPSDSSSYRSRRSPKADQRRAKTTKNRRVSKAKSRHMCTERNRH